jgi:hypothetical protein
VKTPVALALAVALCATPAAAADTKCQAESKAIASRVQRAADAFSKDLSLSGKSQGSASSPQAVLYAVAAGACLIAAATAPAEIGVYRSAAVTEQAACLAAGLAADLADADSSQRLGSIGAPTEKATVAAARASLLLANFLSRPVSEPLRRTASDLQAPLRDAEDILRVCGAGFASPLPFKRLDAGIFDGDVGASFHVTLESGQATRTALEASLHGSTTVSSKANPALKLTVEGDVSLTAGGGGWASLTGHGTARLSGFGPAVTIPNARVASQGAASLTLLGDPAPIRGCTHTVEAGSSFAPPRTTFAGSLRCGAWALTESTLTLDASGVSGGGTFTAWSKRFAMTYDVSGGGGLAVRGSLSGADTPWTRLPGFEAEYRIEAPKIDVRLDGPTLSSTFGAGKVSVRSTAKKPDGNPWASASLTPDTVAIPTPPSDGIPVPFPALPASSDVEKAARDACEAGARRTLAGQALQHALDVCRSGHPSPPAVPSLPQTISLSVGDVLR